MSELCESGSEVFVDGYDEIGVGQSDWGWVCGEPVVARGVVGGRCSVEDLEGSFFFKFKTAERIRIVDDRTE